MEEEVVLRKIRLAILAPPCCTSLDTGIAIVKTPGRIRPPVYSFLAQISSTFLIRTLPQAACYLATGILAGSAATWRQATWQDLTILERRSLESCFQYRSNLTTDDWNPGDQIS